MARCTFDLITTVSPTYAAELKDPYYGEGLDGVIRHLDQQVVGILNGIDESIYDSKTDPALFVPHDNPEKKESGKQESPTGVFRSARPGGCPNGLNDHPAG